MRGRRPAGKLAGRLHFRPRERILSLCASSTSRNPREKPCKAAARNLSTTNKPGPPAWLFAFMPAVVQWSGRPLVTREIPVRIRTRGPNIGRDAESSKGRTTGFDPVNPGSNPGSATIRQGVRVAGRPPDLGSGLRRFESGRTDEWEVEEPLSRADRNNVFPYGRKISVAGRAGECYSNPHAAPFGTQLPSTRRRPGIKPKGSQSSALLRASSCRLESG